MNKDKIVDFSNVYSPKSQSILSKGYKILLNLSKTQPINSKSRSKSKSPRIHKEFVTNIPNVDSYRASTKMTLTD
jgi:hypothetical protein